MDEIADEENVDDTPEPVPDGVQGGITRSILEIGMRIELREIADGVRVALLARAQPILSRSNPGIRIVHWHNIVRAVTVGALGRRGVSTIRQCSMHLK